MEMQYREIARLKEENERLQTENDELKNEIKGLLEAYNNAKDKVFDLYKSL